jgi:hypothetical protein
MFGTGTGGQVLTWNNGVPQWSATSTYTGSNGITTAFANNTLTITGTNAAADGSTKGVAAFTAADFNDNGSGLLSIDYANGQTANASQNGFLSSTDWNLFNNKVSSSSLLSSIAAAFPFTPTAYGVSTSTVVGFTNGLLSMGSTTINGNATTTGNAYFRGNVGIGTTSPTFGVLSVEGNTANIVSMSSSNTGSASVVAGGYTYASAFDSVFIKKYSNGATGNLIGNIPNGDLGALAFQNTTNALIYTNNQTPLILATFGTEALRIGGTGATNHAFVGLSTTSPFAKLSIQAEEPLIGCVHSKRKKDPETSSG